VLYLLIPLLFLPAKSLIFLFLNLQRLEKEAMEPKHIIVFLLAVVGDLPVGSPQKVKESEEGKLMLLGTDGGLIDLVRPHPHAVSLLEELEVMLVQEEDQVALVGLLPKLAAEHVAHAYYPLAVAIRRQYPQTGLLEWSFSKQSSNYCP